VSVAVYGKYIASLCAITNAFCNLVTGYNATVDSSKNPIGVNNGD